MPTKILLNQFILKKINFWRKENTTFLRFKLYRWDVFGYDPEEEHPRPEYLAKLRNLPVTKKDVRILND